MSNRDLTRRINLFSKRFKVEKYLIDRKISFEEIDSANGKQLKVEVCPFCKNINHKGNHHPHRLYIRSDDKRFLCYNCSEKGNIIKLLSGIEQISERSVIDKYIFGDYVELLPEELKILIIESEREKREENFLPPISLPSSFSPINVGLQNLAPQHRYLSRRGLLNTEMVQKFDLRFCKYDYLEWGEDKNGKIKRIVVKDRIIFPIWFEGQIRGWQGRDITDAQKPPYLINKGFQKQLLLYNYDNLKDKEYITLVEGPIDAIKCHEINGICLFGKYLSKVQERYLLKMKNLKKIYLCFDNDDPKALESQQNIAKRLNCFYEVYIINLPDGKDAGDMTPELMVRYKNQAKKYSNDKIESTLV